MSDPAERFCPSCKYKVEMDAAVCAYCGASLEGAQLDRTTEKMAQASTTTHDLQGPSQPASAIPTSGIAVYFVGETKAIAIMELDEFTLGRHVTEEVADIVDLTHYGGLEMGVSRRHALIRRTVLGYEIMDLNSTNGTWLDEKRLVPNKTYPLASGLQIRLGQMLLFTVFGTASGD